MEGLIVAGLCLSSQPYAYRNLCLVLKIMEVTEIQLFIWYKIAIILGAIFPLAKKILENSSIRNYRDYGFAAFAVAVQ
jgi:hypothetical protein